MEENELKEELENPQEDEIAVAEENQDSNFVKLEQEAVKAADKDEEVTPDMTGAAA